MRLRRSGTFFPQGRRLSEASQPQIDRVEDGLSSGKEDGLRHRSDEQLMADVARVRSFIGCCVKGWEKLPADAIDVTVLSGGLSNRLFAVEAVPPVPSGNGNDPDADERQPRQHRHCPCDSRKEQSSTAPDSRSPYPAWDATTPPQRVLVRLYGHGQEHSFFDASEERRVFKILGELGIAPKCLAEFPGGRVETWITGEALKRTDLQNEAVQSRIATILGNFHQIGLPRSSESASAADPAWCRWVQQLPKVFSERIDSEECQAEHARPRCDFAFCRLDAWGATAREGPAMRLLTRSQIPALKVALSREASPDAHEAGVVTPVVAGPLSLLSDAEKRRLDEVGLVQYYQEEAKKLEQVVLARVAHELEPQRLKAVYGSADAWQLLSGASVVFSHNDVQENNVIQYEDGRLQLIDFEYSGRNFRSYDMGNLFREMTIDYADVEGYPFFVVDMSDYPSLPTRQRFIRAYLENLLSVYGPVSGASKAVPHGTVSKTVVDNFEVMVELTGLVSDLLWAFWSLTQMPEVEPLDEFSHVQYALARLTMYEHKKNELVRRGLFPARG
ncbi:putative choline kinase [Neospora caninum Liverpool]|nr:putative choline kinase [Neospora caninum Liverpool]CBZ50495.1 putative choline kinase [Neospora caninum Liverpool]|eukprot:XP_003880528.1 putative choline kinase [Neospora caninum Liverpool]